LERLNKFIAGAGIVSRRNADLLIKAGKVTVNGLVIDQMGARINPAVDRVEVDGNPVKMKETYDYLILNKPPGFLSTVRDPFNRPTVMDLLPASYRELRIYPVGRLDKDTTGLLFFTNDGDLALTLIHPRHLVEKTYLAKVNRIPATSRLSQLSKGILLEDGFTAPAKVGLESIENGNAIVKIILREGRKRQIKRMMAAIGHPVISLHRLTMGPLSLSDLKIGEYRKVNEFELKALLLLKENLGN
jgi:23S rRNA pseudouridine2605 synthase